MVNQVISQLSYLGGPDLVLVSMYVVLMGAQVQDALLHRLKMRDVPWRPSMGRSRCPTHAHMPLLFGVTCSMCVYTF